MQVPPPLLVAAPCPPPFAFAHRTLMSMGSRLDLQEFMYRFRSWSTHSKISHSFESLWTQAWRRRARVGTARNMKKQQGGGDKNQRDMRRKRCGSK